MTSSAAGPNARKSAKSGYASVNSLKMYYEVRGAGQPLVLLHGGAGAALSFLDAPIPKAKSR